MVKLQAEAADLWFPLWYPIKAKPCISKYIHSQWKIQHQTNCALDSVTVEKQNKKKHTRVFWLRSSKK